MPIEPWKINQNHRVDISRAKDFLRLISECKKLAKLRQNFEQSHYRMLSQIDFNFASSSLHCSTTETACLDIGRGLMKLLNQTSCMLITAGFTD